MKGPATRPSGTVTFLFTDVQGSTRLWAADADAMSASLLVHDEILRSAIESRGGYVFTTAGDSFAAAFGRASDPYGSATTSAQRYRRSTPRSRPDAYLAEPTDNRHSARPRTLPYRGPVEPSRRVTGESHRLASELCGLVATLQSGRHDILTGLTRYSEHNGPPERSFSYKFGSTFFAARVP
jgi:hypothetical protein